MKKTFAITAILISFLLISQPVFADTSQTTTNVPLTSSDVIPLISSSGVTEAEPVESNKQISLTISLKLRNKNALKQAINSAHSKKVYGKIVSDSGMTNNYLPDSISHNNIISFLKSNGLTVSKIYNSHLTIKVQGSAQNIEKAFNVQLNYYTQNGTTFFANSNEPQLPANIAGSIESVDGLNNVQLKHSATNLYSSSIPYTPQQIQQAYDLTSSYSNNLNGQGINLAIAGNYSFKQSDITSFLGQYNITGTKPITIIPIDGTPAYNSDGSMETTLDIETAQSSAPGSQLLVYDGANPTSSTEENTFTQIVDDDIANVVSYSWGGDEGEYSPSQLNALDNLFMVGSAKGITFLAASGDNGSASLSYPSTDPYVTAVGGTHLTINGSNGQIASETGWPSSGGGSSAYFAKPTYQQGLSGSKTSYRTTPDVALNADPNTGYYIYYNGSWMDIGGTSASTPEWAAIMALVDQSRQKAGLGCLGLANTDLYSQTAAPAFHDITSGSNGGYSCSSGYDMVTGLGSVDAGKLIGLLTISGYTPVVPTSIILSNSTLNLSTGATSSLTAIVTPSQSVTWTSSDTSVATVSDSGAVTGIAPGTATVTATSQDGTAASSCTVTVAIPAPIALSNSTLTIGLGSTSSLIASTNPSQAVTWKSSSPSIVKVSNGTLAGVKVGTATITATTADGKSTTSCKVTVIKTAVTLSNSTLSVYIGTVANLTATVNPTQNVTWKSSSPAVVTVDNNGSVTAVNAGSATIIATSADGKATATCKVTVLKTVVTLSNKTLSMYIGATNTVSATVRPTQTVTWVSGNPSVATVANGVVTSVGAGTTTITATSADGKGTATCKVTVLKTTVKLSKNLLSSYIGGISLLTATTTPIQSVTWISSNPSVATVSDGAITAVAPGTTTITATSADGNAKATCKVTIVKT
jgi:kumamolisin